MLGLRQHYARQIALAWGLALATPVLAASSGSSALANYTLEITPMIGINLPHDFWGVENTLNVYGVQGAYSVNEAGAVTASVLYHAKDNDWAYTIDSGYRHEIASNLFNAYFDVGLHYSKFNLEIDRDSDGECIPSNCKTDSGSYVGLYAGSGLVVPLSPLTLARMGFRFYNKPQSWVLISAGLSFRF